MLQRKPESTRLLTSEMERLYPQTSQRALSCCRVEMTLHATRPCRSQLLMTDHWSFGDSMQQNMQYCQRSLVVCIASQPALLNQYVTSQQSITPSPTSALVCLPRRSKQLSLCDGAYGLAYWAAVDDISLFALLMQNKTEQMTFSLIKWSVKNIVVLGLVGLGRVTQNPPMDDSVLYGSCG